MVRLEREGDSFVMVTGTSQKQDINVLVEALSELQKNSPDAGKIKEGLLYLENSSGKDVRKDIMSILEKALEYKGFSIKEL